MQPGDPKPCPRQPTPEMIEAGIGVSIRSGGPDEIMRAEWQAMYDAAPALPPVDVEALVEELEGWRRAYPLDVFPEPDLVLVAEILADHGHSLDRVSASNMRHVVSAIVPNVLSALQSQAAECARLREALDKTHKLISQFALSGFTDPQVGEALFANQARIHAALKPARQALSQETTP